MKKRKILRNFLGTTLSNRLYWEMEVPYYVPSIVLDFFPVSYSPLYERVVRESLRGHNQEK